MEIKHHVAKFPSTQGGQLRGEKGLNPAWFKCKIQTWNHCTTLWPGL